MGKRATVGRWNMASACARSVTAYPRDYKWTMRMKHARILKIKKIKYAHLLNEKGNLPFALGKFDPREAQKRGQEVWRMRKEQKKREASGQKLKHFIPD